MAKLYLISKGPYKGKKCILKRKDISNDMWFVSEHLTNELFFVQDNEISEFKLKKYKLKVKR
jgi:hypothetical protein